MDTDSTLLGSGTTVAPRDFRGVGGLARSVGLLFLTLDLLTSSIPRRSDPPPQKLFKFTRNPSPARSSGREPTMGHSHGQARSPGFSRGPLKQLRRLDKSSSKFHDQVSNVLYGEEYKQWVPTIRGDDLVGLVDYLDTVCCRVSLPHSPLRLL